MLIDVCKVEPWRPTKPVPGEWGVRVEHLPSGAVVCVPSQRSQHKTLRTALTMLEAGLPDLPNAMLDRQEEARQ